MPLDADHSGLKAPQLHMREVPNHEYLSMAIVLRKGQLKRELHGPLRNDLAVAIYEVGRLHQCQPFNPTIR